MTTENDLYAMAYTLEHGAQVESVDNDKFASWLREIANEFIQLRAELTAAQQEAGRLRDVVENIEWLATAGDKSRTIPYEITLGD